MPVLEQLGSRGAGAAAGRRGSSRRARRSRSGHLVEREAAQDPTDPGHARVVADLEQRPRRLVVALEPRLQRRPRRRPSCGTSACGTLARPPRRGDRHRRRASRLELDRERDQEPQRKPDDDEEHARRDVEHPLHRPVPTRRTGGRSSKSGAPGRARTRPRWTRSSVVSRREPHADAVPVCLLDDSSTALSSKSASARITSSGRTARGAREILERPPSKRSAGG